MNAMRVKTSVMPGSAEEMPDGFRRTSWVEECTEEITAVFFGVVVGQFKDMEVSLTDVNIKSA
jgi:hypothetical protein